MNAPMTRRKMMTATIPATALGTGALAAAAVAGPGAPPTRRRSAVPAEAFRPLLASWRAARKRRLLAEARLDALAGLTIEDEVASPEGRAFSEADSRLLELEQRLLDLVIQDVGYAPNHRVVDGVILMAATRAGNTDECTLAVIDPSFATT